LLQIATFFVAIHPVSTCAMRHLILFPDRYDIRREATDGAIESAIACPSSFQAVPQGQGKATTSLFDMETQ
jgi:hypothetical protein